MKNLLVSLILILFSPSLFASSIIAKKIFPSTISVVAEDNNGQALSLGSGFMIEDDIAVTNFHVIEGASSGYIKFINQEGIYEILGVTAYNPKFDLALIKVDKLNNPTLELSVTNIDIGDKVYAVGNPLGLEGTFSDGMLSGVRDFEDLTVFQITAPISPGSSGGPVTDDEGNVIGVATFNAAGGQNLNFVIPSKYIKELLNNQSDTIYLSSVSNSKSNDFNSKSKNTNPDLIKVKNPSNTNYSTMMDGNITFSIFNNSRKKIENVKMLFLLLDDNREPIDARYSLFEASIEPKLAKRHTVYFEESGLKLVCTPENIKRFCNNHLEVRVLDYSFAD